MNKDLERIVNYLTEKSGFDFSGYRPAMVERRINHRLIATKSVNFHEYQHYLEKYPAEIENLLNVLTINVSRFFRDTLTFEYIAKIILPAIVSNKRQTHNNSLRIWSVACASGEEPYSIAILINEMLKKKDITLDLNIFATDIDDRALRRAQEGVYSFDQVADIKYGLLKKYFTIKDDSFVVIPKIKKLVNFSTYDILDKRRYVPPESVFGNFDIVFCRNILIYFQIEYQDIIFDKLYRSLAGNGYLVLGTSEVPIAQYRKRFRRVNECCHIYQETGN